MAIRVPVLLPLVVVIAMSCARHPATTPPIEVADVILPDLAQTSITYSGCTEREADTTLVVDVSIPGVIGSERYVFPLKKNPPGEPGELWPFGGACRDGSNGWCNGGVNPREVDERGARIAVRFDWGGTRGEGEVKRELTVPIGGTLATTLEHQTTVRAFYRAPWSAPTVQTLPFFIKLLGGPDGPQAIWEVVEVGDAAVPMLLDAIKDRDASVRAHAVWALGHICGRTGSAAGTAGVVAVFDDPDKRVRENAVHVCLWIKTQQAKTALVEALKSHHEEVRETAKWVLRDQGAAATQAQGLGD